ncbi:hypothetical protein PG991_010815 [Apiospora marii]|uniref:Uncharacterized protein n=1 Tax=Apiospora marii TaxID=335849 RepID=A0ABR1RCF6_9PEZI
MLTALPHRGLLLDGTLLHLELGTSGRACSLRCLAGGLLILVVAVSLGFALDSAALRAALLLSKDRGFDEGGDGNSPHLGSPAAASRVRGLSARRRLLLLLVCCLLLILLILGREQCLSRALCVVNAAYVAATGAGTGAGTGAASAAASAATGFAAPVSGQNDGRSCHHLNLPETAPERRREQGGSGEWSKGNDLLGGGFAYANLLRNRLPVLHLEVVLLILFKVLLHNGHDQQPVVYVISGVVVFGLATLGALVGNVGDVNED